MKMGNTIVSGIQWGDEGKGRRIDDLMPLHDVVVRFQGGRNAGHTVHVGNTKYVAHLIPSGIIREDKTCILGDKMAIDPWAFRNEASEFKDQGIDVTPERLKISNKATVILPYHKSRDAAKAKGKIGTTGNGIGPALADRTARNGIRMNDLFDEDTLEEKLREGVETSNDILKKHGVETFDYNKLLDEVKEVRDYILDFIHKDTAGIIESHNGSVLVEGAQGTMLDLDHGTYPFITSSNPTIGGAYDGMGVAIPFDRIIGVAKAYTTRVGKGPFPTELDDEIEDHLREKGGEYGATTGRARRCGWLDLPVLRYSNRVNGLSEINLTKMDVLSGMEEIKVCVGYEMDNGERVSIAPPYDLENATPIYDTLSGWSENALENVRSADEMPTNARDYVEFIQDSLGVPITNVCVGKEREQSFEYSKSS